MRTSRLSRVAFILACALTWGAGSPPVRATTAGAEARPAVTASDKARDKALLAFQRDLVSVLALRADATPLLGAALLARPLTRQTDALSFHALIERAAAAPGAGAGVTWVRLADCKQGAGNCPNPAAEASLLQQDADNAAVWLLKLGTDTRSLDTAGAREDLARAAQASRYDDYAGVSLQALAVAANTLPPPAATQDPGQAVGASGTRVILVYGLGAAQPRPSLPVVAKLCADQKDDAAVKADCLRLGKLLEWGSSPLARSLGLHLRETLADDPAERLDAERARTNLVWQVQNFAELNARAPKDPKLATQLLTLARNGGTEMSLMLAALRDSGVGTDAPPGWTPRNAR